MSEQLPPLCRVSDLLPVLPIGRTTIWKWVREGKFPQPIRMSARKVVWKRADIEHWLKLENRHV